MNQGDSTGELEGKMIILLVKLVFNYYCFPAGRKNIRNSFVLFFFYFCFTTEQQKTDSQHFTPRPFTHRRPGPPTMVPPKTHVSGPLSNQLATIHSLFNSTQTQTLLQSHSQGTSSTTTTGSGSTARSSISEMSGRNNVLLGNKGNKNNSKIFDIR